LRRVNVKGTSGSGKTTFAQELAERLGVPFV
jgi:adenylate kinase family enzyme